MSRRQRVHPNLGVLKNAPIPGDWAEHAACRGTAPSDGVTDHPFFPTAGRSGECNGEGDVRHMPGRGVLPDVRPALAGVGLVGGYPRGGPGGVAQGAPSGRSIVTLLLGITKTGWRAFRRQEMFTVHFIRKNPSYALCRVRVPYQEKFSVLPRNAVLCDRCRQSNG